MAWAESAEGGITITPAAGARDAAPARPAPELAKLGAPPPQPPRRVGVAEAIGWHPLTFVIPVVLITALGILAGLARTPTYTAEAKLAIGGPASLAGFAANSESLAAGYSQAMHSPGVTRLIRRELGASGGEGGYTVTASSTTGSPVVRVRATESSSSGATDLANAASVALIDYIDRLNTNRGAGRSQLNEFQEATVRVIRLDARLKALKKSDADALSINKAKAARDTAALEAKAASSDYQTSQANRASGATLQVLSPAGAAESDRVSRLQLLAFIGLVVGLAVGAAAASLRANGWGWQRD
jgi:capsular polysaccharide biosynthesis protein